MTTRRAHFVQPPHLGSIGRGRGRRFATGGLRQEGSATRGGGTGRHPVGADPRAEGLQAIGHMGYFRPTVGAVLWPRMLGWPQQHGSSAAA